MNFVDIHSHFLPALDDGARSFETTAEMLEQAGALGTETAVATPHMFLSPFDNFEPERVRERFDDTVLRLRRHAVASGLRQVANMTVLLGAENYLSPEFLEALERRQVLTIAGGRYLLIEFSSYLAAEQIERGMQRVLAAGLVPLIAHVERYPQFIDQPKRLERLVQLGCVGQVNAGSLTGKTDRKLRNRALAHLKSGRAQIVASDGHSVRRRPMALDATAAWLQRKTSAVQVEQWMCNNPQGILSGCDGLHSLVNTA